MNQDNLGARSRVTTQTLGNIKSRILYHRLLGASCASLAIFLLAFTLIPTLISEASAAEDVSAYASWQPVSLTLDPDYGSSDSSSTRGDVLFGDIVPTSVDSSAGAYGTQRVIKKTIGITSNGTYYTVFLSTSSSDNDLALNMDNTDLSIPAIGNGSSTGIWSNPTTFSSSAWGYSVPGTTIPASADSIVPSGSTTAPAFTNIVTGTNLGKDLTKSLNADVYNRDVWAAVPPVSSPQQIWKASTTSTAGFGPEADNINNHFDVYYGIMVDTDILSGTYENEIVYTALASATNLDDVSRNLSREQYIIASGDEQTLHFDLSSSIADPTNIINKDNITVYLVPHNTVLSANYALTDTIKNNASSYSQCAIASNDDIAITDNGATITCTSPGNTPADGTGLGEFDYWLHIDGYNYNYLSHYKKNEQDTATVAYIGLQSKLADSNNELVIKEMQEMNSSICKNTNKWNNQVGDNARIMDYSGTIQLVADITTIDEETREVVVDGAATSEASAAQGIGTFVLIDNRDGKSYDIRHLADENCWMTQGLKLNLADFIFTHDLNTDNTDINSNGKTYWDPAESMYDHAVAVTGETGYEGDPATRENYFQIASNDLLGVSQSAQYVTYTDSMWTTYYYDDENGEKTLGETKRNNKYSEMPRAYNNSTYYGIYYNWYAATAESGTYQMDGSSAAAQDSICPKGWSLADQQGTNKSIRNLYDIAYGLTGNTFKSNVQKIPLQLAMSGYYKPDTGRMQDIYNGGGFLTRNAYSNTQYKAINVYTGGTHGYYSADKVAGLPVRCVARD